MIKKLIGGYLLLLLMCFVAVLSVVGGMSDTSLLNVNNMGSVEGYSSINNRVPLLVYATNSHRINSNFGYRIDPMGSEVKFHNGVDYACTYGDPIYAVADGIVLDSGYGYKGAITVNINHGQGVKSRYVHLQRSYVFVNMMVSQGQQIGECGSTGESTGAHLHLGLFIDDVPVDIAPYLREGSGE
ncbi:MAG: M23 family metallopeptidase [Anaerorhabdus sp.]